jgi:hypothetical protein
VWSPDAEKVIYYLFPRTDRPPVEYIKRNRFNPSTWKWYWAREGLWFDSLEEAKATVLAIVRMGA